MKKEIFNQIVVDNINSKLISVILSNGIKISQELEIEGNRTTKTAVTFIKIEDDYVAIRKRTDVSYDYSGQTRKGDTRNADFYMGYDEIVALEFYDEVVKSEYKQDKPVEDKSKQDPKKVKTDKNKKVRVSDDGLFIKTAGDI